SRFHQGLRHEPQTKSGSMAAILTFSPSLSDRLTNRVRPSMTNALIEAPIGDAEPNGWIRGIAAAWQRDAQWQQGVDSAVERPLIAACRFTVETGL
ncbi:MAG TPA: hypothetical protein VN326_19290, partial [Casimicrobiaceae bacterium]|nr:hypothetical protein [Casimicrobiaceae bacterium]